MTNVRRGKAGFGKSASDAALRGALLIAVAVILGVLLIWRSNRDDAGSSELTTQGSSPPQSTTAPTTTKPGSPAASITTVKGAISITGPTHQPSQVKVIVANGVHTVDRYAGRVSTALQNKGFNSSPHQALDNQLATNIYWREESYQDDAKAVAVALNLSSAALVQRIPNDIDARLPDSTRNLAKTANIVIILGADKLIAVA